MLVFGGIAVQKPAGWQEHCKPESELQCRSRKAVRSTASWSRDCSTKAGRVPGALPSFGGTAVQKPESCQEHCKPEPGLQYRSRQAVRNTASRSRDCSVKAGKPSGALQAGPERAVQNPKEATNNASKRQGYSANHEIKAPAMQA